MRKINIESTYIHRRLDRNNQLHFLTIPIHISTLNSNFNNFSISPLFLFNSIFLYIYLSHEEW